MLELNKLATKHTVVLRWVKAHIGHEGNEKADELAKVGADNIDSLPIVEDRPNLPTNLIRNKLREKVVERWNELWKSSSKCRQTKLFIPEINKTQSVDYTKCRRTVFSAAVQFITGHNFLRRHEAIVAYGHSNFDTAKCRFCQEAEETTYHMLSKCEPFTLTRMLIWGEEKLTPPTP